MNRLHTLVAALVLVALCGAGGAEGQSLSLSSAMVIFPTAGVAQLNARGVEGEGVSISVDPGGSSTVWILYLRADNAALNASGKPVSDLLWRLEGSTTGTALGTTDQAIASGVGPATVKVYLRSVLGWRVDRPGTYGTDVTYTLSTS